MRDEAHRFAITFHRELRGKGMTLSVLDEIPGLGPVRKKALRKEFRSFARLKAASLEQLQAVPGVPNEVAEELYKVLRQYNDEQASGQEGDSHDDCE